MLLQVQAVMLLVLRRALPVLQLELAVVQPALQPVPPVHLPVQAVRQLVLLPVLLLARAALPLVLLIRDLEVAMVLF